MAMSDGGVEASTLEVAVERRICERVVEESRGMFATVWVDILRIF